MGITVVRQAYIVIFFHFPIEAVEVPSLISRVYIFKTNMNFPIGFLKLIIMKKLELYLWLLLILATATVTICCGFNMIMKPMFCSCVVCLALTAGFIYRIREL